MTQRKRPAPPQNRPLRHNTNAAKGIAYRRQDGYAPPTVEDRADQAILAAAAQLGYRLAMQCVDCGHWISNPISVAATRGPQCRARGERR